MADIESGMYYIVNLGAGENVTEDTAYCLSRFGGSASDANDMVIFRQDYRPSPIVSSVMVGTNDELSISAPTLSGKVAAIAQKDITTDAQWTGTSAPTMSNAPAKSWTSTSAKESHVGDLYAVLNARLGTVDAVYKFAKTGSSYFWQKTNDTVNQYPKTNVLVKAEGNWGGRRGRWKMERVENIYLYYGGQPYPVYHLISAMSSDSHKVCMAVTAGTNATRVKTAVPSDGTGNKYQYWAFIPVQSVPDGFYNIRPANLVNRMLIGQSNGSVLLGSDADRDDNRGIWVISKDDLKPDHQNLRNLEPIIDKTPEASYMMVASGQAVEHGVPSVGNPGNGGHFQRWVFVARGESKEYNENTYQAYEMWSNAFDYTYWAVSRYVLTYQLQNIEGTLTYPQFTLINASFTGNALDNQWFLTRAHAYDSKLTVPTKLALDVSDSPNYSIVGVSGDADLYPSWIGGDNAGWQLRYRFVACRYVTDESPAMNHDVADSTWKSIFDDDPANDGWGDNEIYNCEAVLSYNESNANGRGASGRYRSVLPIHAVLENQNGSMDKVTVEFQVRAWNPQFKSIEGLTCHGGSASAQFTIAYRPTLTFSNLKVDAYGISVDFSSDFARDSNNIVISNSEYFAQMDTSELSDYDSSSERYRRLLNQRLCENGLAEYSGTYYADFAGPIPAVGDRIPLSWTITTVDGVTVSGTELVTVSSSDFSDADAVACPTEYTSDGSRILNIDVSGFDSGSARCWLIINRRPNGTDSASEFEFTADNNPYLDIVEVNHDGTVIEIPYPFGCPFKVMVFGDHGDRAGRFEHIHSAFDEFRDRTRMWNYDGGWYEIFVNKGDNPDESVSTSYSSNAVKATERKWETVQFGNTPEQSRSVSGVVVSSLMDNYVQRTLEFSKCKYAWYRSFDGEVMRVAVTSVKETRMVWGDSVSVEMRRIDA